MDEIQSLQFDMEAGIIGVDNDGGVVLFDPDHNQVGYCSADWDELSESDRTLAARTWSKSSFRLLPKNVSKREAHYHQKGFVAGGGI